MHTSPIYIASSQRALALSEALRDQLMRPDCFAETWKTEVDRALGQTKIEMLEHLSKKYEFAVIIMAKTDIEDKGDNLKSRDDCVFEAGFFMAVMGRRRCFLLSSVEEQDLPLDLKGVAKRSKPVRD
jgi:predicted nucleotide-binding protein